MSRNPRMIDDINVPEPPKMWGWRELLFLGGLFLIVIGVIYYYANY